MEGIIVLANEFYDREMERYEKGSDCIFFTSR
jgi:hypothetical protein